MTGLDDPQALICVDSIQVASRRGKGRTVARLREVQGNEVQRVNRAGGSKKERLRYAPWLSGGSVQLVDLAGRDVHMRTAFRNEARQCRPVMLTAGPLSRDLLGLWSWTHLEAACAGQKNEVEIWYSSGPHARVIEHDPSKNIYGSLYHVREPESSVKNVPLSDTFDAIRHWKQHKVFCKVQIATFCNGCTGSLEIKEGRDPLPKSLHNELLEHLKMDWFEELARETRCGLPLRASLEVGAPGLLLPARYACCDRLLLQDAFRGLYAYPVHHTYDRYSMVDLEEADCKRWPLLKDVRGLSCLLQPGQALLIPAYWFAHVDVSGPEDLCLVTEMGVGRQVRGHDALEVAVSRVIEQRVASSEGPAFVRKWLTIIGRCEERHWIDVATVEGFRRVLMCEEVRQEATAVVGEAGLAAFLQMLVDGRLLPTPWLNQNFREPLYLKDKPQLFLDLRSNDEMRYPELFRQSIQSKEKLRVPVPDRQSIQSNACAELPAPQQLLASS